MSKSGAGSTAELCWYTRDVVFTGLCVGVDVSAIRSTSVGDQLLVRAYRSQASSVSPRSRPRVGTVRGSPRSACSPHRGGLQLQLDRHDRQKADRENAR